METASSCVISSGLREGLFAWAVRSYFRHRREVPVATARNPHLRLVHLRTQAEVDAFLGSDPTHAASERPQRDL